MYVRDSLLTVLEWALGKVRKEPLSGFQIFKLPSSFPVMIRFVYGEKTMDVISLVFSENP